MKLLRYVAGDQVKPGILDADGNIRDLSSIVPDIDGDSISPEGLDEIAMIDPASLPKVIGNPLLAPPVANPSKERDGEAGEEGDRAPLGEAGDEDPLARHAACELAADQPLQPRIALPVDQPAQQQLPRIE